MWFGMKGRLAPGYIGPYKIIENIGHVTYKLILPPHLAKIHNVFHVSLVHKAKLDPFGILPLIPIEIREDLTVHMKRVRILDHNIKKLRNKKVHLVRVLWKNSHLEEETWERESEI